MDESLSKKISEAGSVIAEAFDYAKVFSEDIEKTAQFERRILIIGKYQRFVIRLLAYFEKIEGKLVYVKEQLREKK